MPKNDGYITTQIRELPLPVWDNIKTAAAFTGQSANDYVVALLTKTSNMVDQFKAGGFATSPKPRKRRAHASA